MRIEWRGEGVDEHGVDARTRPRGRARRSALLPAYRGRNAAGRCRPRRSAQLGWKPAVDFRRSGARDGGGDDPSSRGATRSWPARAIEPSGSRVASTSSMNRERAASFVARAIAAWSAPPSCGVAARCGFDNLLLRTSAELDLRQRAVNDFFAAERPEHVFLAAARVGGIHANDYAAGGFHPRQPAHRRRTSSTPPSVTARASCCSSARAASIRSSRRSRCARSPC